MVSRRAFLSGGLGAALAFVAPQVTGQDMRVYGFRPRNTHPELYTGMRVTQVNSSWVDHVGGQLTRVDFWLANDRGQQCFFSTDDRESADRFFDAPAGATFSLERTFAEEIAGDPDDDLLDSEYDEDAY